jgi:hypothetical protein
MFFAEELAKLANLGILDHDGSLLGLRGNHIVNRQARGGGNSNCRWAGILIVADQPRLFRPSIPNSRRCQHFLSSLGAENQGSWAVLSRKTYLLRGVSRASEASGQKAYVES